MAILHFIHHFFKSSPLGLLFFFMPFLHQLKNQMIYKLHFRAILLIYNINQNVSYICG